jgi:hypothetical protein
MKNRIMRIGDIEELNKMELLILPYIIHNLLKKKRYQQEISESAFTLMMLRIRSGHVCIF